jgi:hypothetical protein
MLNRTLEDHFDCSLGCVHASSFLAVIGMRVVVPRPHVENGINQTIMPSRAPYAARGPV